MLRSCSRYSRLRTVAFAALTAAMILVNQAPPSAAAAEPVVDPSPVVEASPVVDPSPAAAVEPVATPILVAAPLSAAISRPVPVRASAAVAVVRAAESHLGARYRPGAIGPRWFDCSGLVYRSFAQVGLTGRIGGLQSARGLYTYFARHHLASRHAPKLGDLVIWGGGSHVGIYVGSGRAISALTSGVRITRVTAVLSGFTTYLHTRLGTAPVSTKQAATVNHPAATKSSFRRVTGVATLRSAPGTTQRRIAVLQRGVRLAVIGSRHLWNHQVWLQVRTSGGRTGWVASWLTHA